MNHVRGRTDRLDVVAADARDAPLGPGEIRLWVADLEHHTATCGEETLDAQEREHAARLRSAQLQSRYVTAHLFLRERLSAVTGATPHALPLARRPCRVCGKPHGKPFLEGDPVSFNLSHSGDLVVLAATATAGELGVDVELRQQEDRLLEAPEAFATTRELTQIARRPPSEHPRALLTSWVRKEAVLKARGDGLNLAPTEVEMPDTAPETGRVQIVGVHGQTWRVMDVVLPEAFAAIATRTAGAWLSLHRDAPAPAVPDT